MNLFMALPLPIPWPRINTLFSLKLLLSNRRCQALRIRLRTNGVLWLLIFCGPIPLSPFVNGSTWPVIAYPSSLPLLHPLLIFLPRFFPSVHFLHFLPSFFSIALLLSVGGRLFGCVSWSFVDLSVGKFTVCFYEQLLSLL